MSLKDVLFGKPISSEQDEGERVGPVKGVAILGLDALASAAYGPEALLTMLLPLGLMALRYVLPLTLLIVAVLLALAVSYRQTINAYPDGGGAYTVAKDNLGANTSLIAAAALTVDYVLNVAVAISAGVGALVSAFPPLLPHTLGLSLGVLVVLTIVNLRGVRATGLLFVFPTYCFVGSLFIVIAIGMTKTLLHGHPPHALHPTSAPVSLWLLMRAFANGCTAMTGVEAVSNGTPIFHPPSQVGARRTLAAIVGCLVILLLGVATLASSYGLTATMPGEPGYESLLSRLTGATVGRGAFYYFTIGSVVAVLAFSANTSFAGFPRVCRLLAADRYLPEPFVHRGRRLTFSYGIVVLSLLAALLLIVFRGITDALIPLFAVGALAAFTMSQIGMVAHWRKESGRHTRHALVVNAVGAAATAATLVVVLASKLVEGAWISIAIAIGMFVVFKKVRSHYELIAEATATTESLSVGAPRPPIAVVPMRRWDAVTLKAMRFAIGLSDDVIAVQVLIGDREVDDLRPKWDMIATGPLCAEGRRAPRLVVLRSEYRRLYAPLIDFVADLERENPERPIAVIVPELIEARWYYHLLHGHTASMMKALLLLRGGPQTVIVSIPFYLRCARPDRKRLDWSRWGKGRLWWKTA